MTLVLRNNAFKVGNAISRAFQYFLNGSEVMVNGIQAIRENQH